MQRLGPKAQLLNLKFLDEFLVINDNHRALMADTRTDSHCETRHIYGIQEVMPVANKGAIPGQGPCCDVGGEEGPGSIPISICCILVRTEMGKKLGMMSSCSIQIGYFGAKT